jgi:hypothetical protein
LSGVLVSKCGSLGYSVAGFGINMHVKGHVQCTTAYYYSNKCIYEKKKGDHVERCDDAVDDELVDLLNVLDGIYPRPVALTKCRLKCIPANCLEVSPIELDQVFLAST